MIFWGPKSILTVHMDTVFSMVSLEILSLFVFSGDFLPIVPWQLTIESFFVEYVHFFQSTSTLKKYLPSLKLT